MSQSLCRAEFVSSAVTWINRALAPNGVTIDSDTPLFASGFINSIRILDLIAFTERATGRQIDDRQIRMDNFRTVARIAEVFIAETSSPREAAMWPLDQLYLALRERGELWEPMPGLVGLRGHTARLYRALGERIALLCGGETDDEWRVPAAIPLAALERADYFASFPQWLTLAGHLSNDEEQLRRVAFSTSPAECASRSMEPSGAALTPALCYHVYSALAGQCVVAPRIMTAQTTCWRHEHPNHVALERDWAFTMREVVCIGAEADVRAFVDRVTGRVSALAATLGMEPDIVEATDPFFAPPSRGKQLLQRLQSLKHELTLPVTAQRRMAASSFNLHQTFFGEAFDIRDGNGSPVHSGCVAFGIERWTLAFLVRHGPDPEAWLPFMEDTIRAGAAHDVVTY